MVAGLSTRLAVLASVLALSWALVARAGEDQNTRDAREHLGRAKIHFKLREFDAAASEFREAYRLKPVPGLLFNIAQCERMRGKFRESKFYYEQYLHDVPDAANVDEVKHQIAELTKLIEDESKEPAASATAAATPAPAPAPAPAPVVAKLVVPLPAPKEPVSAPLPKPEPITAPLSAPAPKPEPIAAQKPEPVAAPKPEPMAAPKPEPVAAPAPTPEPVTAPAPKTIAITAPKQEPITAPLPAVTAPFTGDVETVGHRPDPEHPTVEKSRSAWPVVMLVLAAAGGGAGGYFGWDAQATHSAADAAVYQDEASQKAQSAQSKALVANVLYGVAGAAAIAGVAGVLTW